MDISQQITGHETRGHVQVADAKREDGSYSAGLLSLLSNYILVLWAHSLAWLGFEVWDLGTQDVKSLVAFDMGFQILVSPFSYSF